jgi:hypothetical protein
VEWWSGAVCAWCRKCCARVAQRWVSIWRQHCACEGQWIYVIVGPGVFQFAQSSFELHVVSRPRIDAVVPSSFVSGHSAAFHLIGKFYDFPSDIAVMFGVNFGYCSMANSSIFFCKIDNVFADSHRLSLFISLVASNSTFFVDICEIVSSSSDFGIIY